MQTVNLFIGGDHCPAASGKRFERSNPITGDVATSAAAATVEDATRAADAAAAAFPSGRQRRPVNAAACFWLPRRRFSPPGLILPRR
jgi:acyl-CoA reductase-like NAD-dependent aldehyde dehydrogenase